MIKSETISKISVDLLKAQTEMSTPKKDASNPFFKSKYADLNAVREACIGALNNNGICLLQPVVTHDGKNYVQTLLLHSSGEFIGGETEIKAKAINDPQAEGSGITYARRFGLQSLLGLGAEDDDGNAANKPQRENNNSKVTNITDKPAAKTNQTEADKTAYAVIQECENAIEMERLFKIHVMKVSDQTAFTKFKNECKAKLPGSKNHG